MLDLIFLWNTNYQKTNALLSNKPKAYAFNISDMQNISKTFRKIEVYSPLNYQKLTLDTPRDYANYSWSDPITISIHTLTLGKYVYI